MFARLDHEIPAVLFPKNWADESKQVLLNVYGEHCLKDDKTFEVFGFSYPSELLLTISYASLDKFVAPVTLFISTELTTNTESDTVMGDMFDFAGTFFDSYFNELQNEEESWENYILDWQEVDYHGKTFFYKVTRENIALTIEANFLLGE